MSYILDALKKAAEQRAEQTPALRRLIAASPVASTRPARRRIVVAASIAAAAMVAVGLGIVWPTRPPAPRVTEEIPRAAVTAVVPSPADHTSAEIAPHAPAASRVPPPSLRAAPVVPADRAASPPAPAPVAPVPGGDAVEQNPTIAALPPMPPEDVVRLKIEALVYSEVRAERMVFINGRKYVEGDSVPDGGRLEEIKPDGVVFSDHGRRQTLRP